MQIEHPNINTLHEIERHLLHWARDRGVSDPRVTLLPATFDGSALGALAFAGAAGWRERDNVRVGLMYRLDGAEPFPTAKEAFALLTRCEWQAVNLPPWPAKPEDFTDGSAVLREIRLGASDCAQKAGVKHKTWELEGELLDAAVAVAMGARKSSDGFWFWPPPGTALKATFWKPSQSWAQCGPIIERERINLQPVVSEGWYATCGGQCVELPLPIKEQGPTPLIAAMRAFVAAKLGQEVELP